MSCWHGKVAVITGASSGIGAEIAKQLVKIGLIVVGLARRKIYNLNAEDLKGKFYSFECDVKNADSVQEIFKRIENQFGEINILVNNAGVVKFTQILEPNNSEALMDVINTNLNGFLFCTKAAYKSMNKLNSQCIIINIGSILSHHIPFVAHRIPLFNVYPGTKYAMRAITEVLRQELIYHKNSHIRISNICPGLVKTNILKEGGFPVPEEIFKNSALNVEDISAAVIYILETPINVEIQEIILSSTINR